MIAALILILDIQILIHQCDIREIKRAGYQEAFVEVHACAARSEQPILIRCHAHPSYRVAVWTPGLESVGSTAIKGPRLNFNAPPINQSC
jgi:hypothetical protein